jgi:hypothetical protein
MSDYYDKTGAPSTGSLGSSSTIRAEFEAVETAMAKLPALTGNGDEIVKVNTGGTALESVPQVAVAQGGTNSATASGARTNLGVVIGTDVQAFDAGLLSIAGLTTAANKMVYTTASDTYAVTDLSAFGRSLIDDASASAARTTLAVVIGTDVQAHDANLDQIAALAVTDSNFMVGNGSAWVVESGATARTSLGLGSIATLSTISQGNLNTATGTITNATSGTVNIALPGGSFGFYPETKQSSGSYDAGIASGASRTSFAPNAFTTDNGGTVSIRQEYIQASPPYDLGDGEIPLFVFAMIDDSTSKVIATYSAPEAPWHYNGPTKISADFYGEDGRAYQKRRVIPESIIALRDHPQFKTDKVRQRDFNQAIRELPVENIEIDQALKQADMLIIPHPWVGNNMAGRTVVLLDPVSSEMLDLKEFQLDESDEGVHEVLSDYFNIGNTGLVRKGPPGIMVVSANWKPKK